MNSQQRTFTNITKDNAAYYAAIVYNNPHFVKPDQFYKDLRRISTIKKQMNKFDTSDDIDLQDLVRKITNNIIIFLNLFGTDSGLKILYALMEERFWSKLTSIIMFIMEYDKPKTIEGINNTTIILEMIEIDEFFSGFVYHMEEYRGIHNKGL